MIFLTRVTPPASGAIVALYCKHCRRTEITLSEHAPKPTDGGDMWIINLPCAEHSFLPPQFFSPPAVSWYPLKWPGVKKGM